MFYEDSLNIICISDNSNLLYLSTTTFTYNIIVIVLIKRPYTLEVYAKVKKQNKKAKHTVWLYPESLKWG